MTRDEALRVMGLGDDAREDDVRTAYRELAQMLHPDKYGSSKRLRARAEQQMRTLNEARDLLLRSARCAAGPDVRTQRDRSASSSSGASRRGGSSGGASTASPASIAAEADARARAAETARLAVVADLRTLRERRRGMVTLLVCALIGALIFSRLRGTVGALGSSIASMLVVWGAVDAFTMTSQINVLRRRSAELLRTRDAALDIARRAREL